MRFLMQDISAFLAGLRIDGTALMGGYGPGRAGYRHHGRAVGGVARQLRRGRADQWRLQGPLCSGPATDRRRSGRRISGQPRARAGSAAHAGRRGRGRADRQPRRAHPPAEREGTGRLPRVHRSHPGAGGSAGDGADGRARMSRGGDQGAGGAGGKSGPRQFARLRRHAVSISCRSECDTGRRAPPMRRRSSFSTRRRRRVRCGKG